MKKEIKIAWKEGMAFEADVDGHKIMLDTREMSGGSNLGPSPKPLMLVALAGCTGMDVISILAKMRIKPDGFDVKVEAPQTEDQPVHYTSMHITYEFIGHDLPFEKLEKAINLSHERYCGVSAVYKKVMPVTYSIVVHQTEKPKIQVN